MHSGTGNTLARRRIWSETLPWERLASRSVLDLLARYGLALRVAVRPWDLAALPGLLARCEDAGVPVGLWPMLDDAAGRWPSAGNAEVFADFVSRMLDALAAPPRELVMDLEPAIDLVAALFSRVRPRTAGRALAVPDPQDFQRGRRRLTELGERLRGAGVATAAAVVPMVLLDGDRGDAWQRLLGTPVDGPPWDRVNVMLYTSILEGWSRGMLGRRGAVALLERGCHAARRRFGATCEVSLGAVSGGALGDEPTYRAPHELAEDVSVARAAGVEDLCLFDLAGVLQRPPAEAWLEALVGTGPARRPPRSSLRAALATSLGAVLARGVMRARQRAAR